MSNLTISNDPGMSFIQAGPEFNSAECIEEATPYPSWKESMDQAKRPLKDRIQILNTKDGWETALVDQAIKIKQISKEIRDEFVFRWQADSICMGVLSLFYVAHSLRLILARHVVMDILAVIGINIGKFCFYEFANSRIIKADLEVDVALAVAELRSILLYPEMYSDRYKQDKLRSFRESKRLNSIELEKKVLTTAEKSMQSFLIEEQNNSYKNS